jgi:hypothetical protein
MGFLEGIVLLILVVVGFVAYLLPSIIAAYRNHPNSLAILLLNLLAGWTFAGWVGALVWSCIDLSQSNASRQVPTDPHTSQQLSN